MYKLILLITVLLSLASCGKNEQHTHSTLVAAPTQQHMVQN